tara:strand:- start:2077 stop:2442 length:366 start_codon:yes stop_codon:yes gene_type:complete
LSNPSKASLVKQCKDAGIPLPDKADRKVMEHRLANWLPGKGWLFRLARPSGRKEGHPVQMLNEWNTTYWVPNSMMAELIAKSKLVFVLGRVNEPPQEATVIDVPKDFSDRWLNGGIDGSNN